METQRGLLVVLNRCGYIIKLLQLLTDGSKFSKDTSGKDQTDRAGKAITTALKTLKCSGYISFGLFEELKHIGSARSKIYGLSKIHKTGLSLCQTLSLTTSAYRAAARWLIRMLEPVRKQIANHIIGDRFWFVDAIKEINVDWRIKFSLGIASVHKRAASENGGFHLFIDTEQM